MEWNAQMAATAETVGYDYGLAPARFIASHGWEFQQEPTICTSSAVDAHAASQA